MSEEQYSWVIRAGKKGEPNDGEERACFDDKESAIEAFRDFDLDDRDEPYDWAELVEIDWYYRGERVLGSIARSET